MAPKRQNAAIEALATVFRSPLTWVATVALIASVGALAVMAQVREPAVDVSKLPDYGPLPSFELTNQRGEKMTPESFAGKVVIANFIFTRCPTVCPVFTMKMKRVEERTAGRGDRIALLSFSVDPEYDTPQVLAEYAVTHKADTSRWSFLTGPLDEVISTVETSMKIALDRREDFETGIPNIVHGTHFVLVDRHGRIRGYYDSDVVERIEQLVADAMALADAD